MVRDAQRSKLYQAESVLDEHQVFVFTSPGEVLDGGTVHIGRPEWTSVAEVQAFVDRVVTSAWWKKRSPIRHVTVKDGRGGTNARAYRSRHFGIPTIAIPRWARSQRVVLHELAHHLTEWGAEAHGHLFAANLIDLVRRFMSRDDADRLTEAFRQAKVKHRR